MTWNIFDQSNSVSYQSPSNGSGYWQKPPDIATRDELTYLIFTKYFKEQLNQINNWRESDYLAGISLAQDYINLLRIHNGGKDKQGRPDRWVLYIWSEPISPKIVNLKAWIYDKGWPAPNVVPLPATIPKSPYQIPYKPFDNLSSRTSNRNNLDKIQLDWDDWIVSPDRENTGWVAFSSINGKFHSASNLNSKSKAPINRSITNIYPKAHFPEVASCNRHRHLYKTSESQPKRLSRLWSFFKKRWRIALWVISILLAVFFGMWLECHYFILGGNISSLNHY